MIGTSKNIFGFDPRSIPDCVVWLDAADTSTLTLSGSNITAWRDKSIYGNHVNDISAIPPTYNSTDSSVNFLTTSSNFMRGTMSQTYSSNATVFIVPSVTSTATVLGFPRLSTLSTSAASDTALAGQFLILNLNTANPMTYLATGTNPTGQGTNITTFLSNSYTNDVRFLVTNTSTWSGTAFSVTTLLNGNSQSTSSFSQTRSPDSYYVSTYNKYTFATGPVNIGDCFNGKIFEYLVFSRALTTIERQQVEGYLTWKWRLAGYSPLTPLTLGCQLWLDAADISTITLSGSNMTQWNDKSGNANNMLPWTTFSNATIASNFQNNLNVLNFSATGVYQGTISNGPYPSDVYLVMALKDTTTHADVISVYSSNAGSTFNSLTFGENVASRWHNGSDGFARTPLTVAPSNETSTSFLLMNWSLSNNNYIIRRNGTQLSRTTSYTYTRPLDSRFQIGYRINPSVFSPATTAGPLRGYIGEIVAFNTQLGDVQRQQIETYLGLKWGLSNVISRLPIENPYVSLKPHLRIFQPTDIAGCVVWLDGADQSTLTLSGSNITAWRDKTVFKNNVNSISATAPTYNSADSSVNFVASSGTFMRGTMSQTYSNSVSVFVVASIATQSTPSFPRLSMLGLSTTANSILIGQQLYVDGGNPRVITYLPTNTNPVGQGTNIMTLISNVTYGTRQVITNVSSYIGTTYTISTLLNGNPQNTSVSTTSGTFTANSANVASYNKYSLANYPDAASTTGDSYNGKIFEYLVFNRVLTTAERQQVEGYLTDKWGLLNQTYSLNTPLSIPGCTMWLDGADPAGTGTPPSAGTLATWVDKSLSGRNAIQYSTFSRPSFVRNSLNSRGGVSFTAASSNCYQTQTVLPTPGTIFVVGFSSNDGFILSGNPNIISGHPPYYATFARDVEFGINNTSDQAFLVNLASTSNVNYILTGVYTGTNVTAIMNDGQLSNTIAFSGTPKTPALTLIGINSYAGTLNAPLGGTINEFITYSSALTISQRQQVERYLADKWGLTLFTQIPFTHPFRAFPPSTVTRPNFLELPYTPTNNNVFLAKYSSDGSVLWALRHVAPTGVIPRDLTTDLSGNVYFSSYYEGALTVYATNGTIATTKLHSGSQDGYLAKYSSEGVLLWMARNAATGGNFGVGIAVDLSQNVYLGGVYSTALTLFNPDETSSIQLTTVSGPNDGFLAKYSPAGTPLWVARTSGTSFDSGGVSLKTDSSGNVYSVGINVLAAVTFFNANGTTGGSLSFTGATSEATWLASWDTSGTFRWALRFVTNDLNSSPGALSIDSSANLYVSSAYNATMTLRNTADTVVATLSNSGAYDAFIASYTSAGAYRWHARIVGTGSSDIVAHTNDSSGNQYVFGVYTSNIIIYNFGETVSNTLTNSGSYDAFLVKYSSAGVLLWSTRIASTNLEYTYMPSADSNGNVYVSGRYEGTCTFFNVGGGIGATLSNITAPDVFLAEYTTNGQLIWATRIGGTGADYEGALATDPRGDVYVSGFYQSSPLTLFGV
jgi:hypothetical protein